jgi:SpoIID/LytB domain protein
MAFKKYLLIITVLSLTLLAGFFKASVRADELDDINQQISQLTAAREQSIAATKPLEGELSKLNTQLDSIKAGIAKAQADLRALEASILLRENDFVEQYVLLSERVLSFYKSSRQPSSLFILFASGSGSNILKDLFYQQTVTDRDKGEIEKISLDLIALEADKQKAEEDRVRLADLQAKVDKEADFFRKEVAGAQAFQAQLSGQIAALSAKQQQLLAAKFSSAPVPLLAYTSLSGCSSDIGKSPGFSPRYGFFSYGVPNKTGLNQYGAKGRAEAGQDYEQILKAYYNDIQIVDYGTGFNITVNGTNEYGQNFDNESMNIEEYLKHLYEMPAEWNSKALKAQAIAARSYALARTNNGQTSIPPNQSGQVVKKEENDSSWKDAVKDTEGKVMVQGGSPISAWYSSTHGGVVLRSGQIGWSDKPWTKQAIDTSSGSAGSFSELRDNAYDKNSPWFFCDWGYRGEYNNTAWLKESEVVDIVNAYLLWQKDNNNIIHLSQTDESTSDTWSEEKVRQELGGEAITSISNIEVLWDNSGISQTIRVNGQNFNAQKFKNMFNLRAPANIQIKPACQPDSALNCSQMYGLYNVIKE